MSLLAFLAETAADGGDAVKAPFTAFDPTWFASQLFWLAVFFLGLYFALARFVLPKLSDTLEKRSNRIAADLDEAARLNNQSVEAQKALELRLSQARSRARETADKAREKTEAELATETMRVDADLARKLETAEGRISKLRADAMKKPMHSPCTCEPAGTMHVRCEWYVARAASQEIWSESERI